VANRIKGITVEIGGDTTGLEKALKSVNSAIRSTQSSLRDVNRLLKLDPKNTTLLTQKQKMLKDAISSTKEKLESLKQAQVQAKQQLENGDLGQDKYDALQREIAETEQKLKGLEKESRNFGSVSSQKIAAAGEKVKSVGDKMADAGTKMTVGFTAPVVAGATAAVNSYGNVDKQFNLVKQTMGSTANSAEDFKGLWNQIGESAKSSVFGMQDAADATLNFARQGFTAKQATDMLTPAMNLAAGTGTDLSEVTSGLGNAMKMFGADSSEAASYSDVLAKAQAQANTNTSELFESISVAGPICKTVGWDIRDLATLTDVFGNAGISGSEGANALKTGLARLASPAKSGAQAMDQLKLSTGQTYAIFNDNGTLKDMPTVLKNLNSAFSGLSDQEKLEAASNIFGKEQMSKWLTLIQTSPKDIGSLRDALDSASGSAGKMSKALMSGTGGTIEQLKSTFDVLVVTIGQLIAPVLQKFFTQLISIMNAIMNMNPAMQRIVLTLIGIAAAIGPLLITIGKIATGVGTLMTLAPKIVSAIKLVRTGMASFNAVLLANPIALVVAAVALLSATFVYLWKTNAKFRNGIITIWNSLKAYTTKVWSSIRKLAVTTWGAIKSAVLSPVRAIRSSVTSSWAALRSTTARVWNGIKSAMLTPINSARDRIRGIINSIRGFFPMRIGNIFSDLRLPHIHVQGGKAPFGIGGKGSLPKFSVDWYAKAMKNGMILNSPTIFGMSSSSLLAGGEAGSETVVGTESLMNMIRAAVSGVGNDVANAVLTANRIALSGASSSDIHLDVYLFKNGPKMGEEIVHAYDTYKRRLG
jgi:TP901 family phage tail tape measure protein